MDIKRKQLSTKETSSYGQSISIPGCLTEKLNSRLLLCSKKSCIHLQQVLWKPVGLFHLIT